MVIPTIGIVICDYYRSRCPFRPRLQEVDDRNHKSLFIQRVGVAGMTILKCWRLEEAYRRHVPCLYRRVKILEVILVVRRVSRMTNRDRGRWPEVQRIGRRRIVLKRLMVRDIISRSGNYGGTRRTCAARGSVGIRDLKVKASLEPAPSRADGIQKVADVSPRHRDSRARRCGTDVP